MIVALDKITNAMMKVKSFAQDIKTVPGVLLNLGDNSIDVCYSDGKKSFIEKIDAIIEDGEQLGEIVVPYQVFLDMLNVCQPSGGIVCDELTITANENNILTIETVKYAIVGEQVGDDFEEVKKPVSKFKQEIKYHRVSEDIRYGILSRMDYQSIFNSDKLDIWDKDVLQGTLARLSKEGGKVCYLSGQLKAAFVVNVDHTIYIPRDEIEECGFSLNSKMAKYINEILSKTNDDKIQVSVEDMRYCKITTPDEKMGIWFEMEAAAKMDLITLKSYENKKYDKYQIVFNRYALHDAVKRATSSDNTDTTSFTFSNSDSGLVVNIISGGTASKSKDFYVIAEDYSEVGGDIEDLKIPVSLKALNNILDNCVGNYLVFDIADDDTGKCIRITDTSGRDEYGKPIVEAYNYTLSSK